MNGELVFDSICLLGFATANIYFAYSLTKKYILQNFIPTSKPTKYPKRYRHYIWSLLLAPLSPLFYSFVIYNNKTNDSIAIEYRLAFCILVCLVSLFAVFVAHDEMDNLDKREYDARLKREYELRVEKSK